MNHLPSSSASCLLIGQTPPVLVSDWSGMECEESRWPWLRHGVISKTPLHIHHSPHFLTGKGKYSRMSWRLITRLVDVAVICKCCLLFVVHWTFSPKSGMSRFVMSRHVTVTLRHSYRDTGHLVTDVSKIVTNTGQSWRIEMYVVIQNQEMRSEAWFMRETAETISSQNRRTTEVVVTCHSFFSVIPMFVSFHWCDHFPCLLWQQENPGCEMSCWFWLSVPGLMSGRRGCPRLTKHPLHHHQGLDLWQFGSRRQFSSAYPTLELSEGRRIHQSISQFLFGHFKASFKPNEMWLKSFI